MLNLKQIKAGENDILELPSEIGNMPVLRDLHLNDNVNLNNLPAELSLCSTLTILGLVNCPLRDLPQPIVVHGSAMIIYVSLTLFHVAPSIVADLSAKPLHALHTGWHSSDVCITVLSRSDPKPSELFLGSSKKESVRWSDTQTKVGDCFQSSLGLIDVA
ncbi:unnamed protein product [Dibothriocephalus latus]|uniref:Uncharacterized protein n=1 Tax=Dibothriocephalus latus TaxID=60516 RepID=A0A3P7QF88_DIBLA|nr:unnamed protein product [Dibothriocephalus latus]